MLHYRTCQLHRLLSTSDSDNDCFESLDEDPVENEAEDVLVLPDIQEGRHQGQLAIWDNFLEIGHQESASGCGAKHSPPHSQ